MKRCLMLLLLSFAAVSAFAQKGPADELGFHADKLYDFSSVDSVSLYNGNLMITIPIGVRYTLSSTLSYQLTLVYNGKTIDTETWCEDPFNEGCFDNRVKAKRYPNLRANAGNGWRVSLGRLLPPVDTGLLHDSLDDPDWIYEGPSGDEHGLTQSNTATPDLVAGLRMQVIDSLTREVQFGSGEVHRFVLQNSTWRLTQIRDRFGNWVDITYAYDGLREIGWSIDDSAGRHHTVTLQNYPAMNDGWSRGQQISSIDLQGFGGGRAVYSLCYNGDCSYNAAGTPVLTEFRQPDGTKYTFANGTYESMPVLNHVRYPTGATVDYEIEAYQLPSSEDQCSIPLAFPAVTARTVRDGSTIRTTNYVQQVGPQVPSTPNLYDPCGTGDNHTRGPFYWTRTSVLAPVDGNNHRVRTDHYFSSFTDLGVTLTSHLPGEGQETYSHSGTIGAPPLSSRKQPGPFFAADADASDSADPATMRLLATETFADCDAAGDCTNGTLLRSTYDRHIGSVGFKAEGFHVFDNVRLISSRTVYSDGRWPLSNPPVSEAPCGSAPCYTQVTYSDDNGAGRFRTTTATSNFPGAQDVTATTQYPSWSSADLNDLNRPWLLDIYTEKTRTEGGVTARQLFCFDGDTGALSRNRVLANPVQGFGSHDIVHVFTYDHGDVRFASDYGGDVQTLDTASPLCSMPLPSQPWYKIESTYTNGVRATSRYYDRNTGAPLGFLALDRTIDSSTGVVTAARDTAGVATAYGYTPKPARLETVTDAAGTVTTYSYTNATGSADTAWTPARVAADTSGGSDMIRAEYMFDALGRVQRESHRQPDQWSATETAYDELGRVAWKSQPESTGANPASGPLTAAHKTTFKYDPFGRTTSVTGPDDKTASFVYSGVRLRRRTVGVGLQSGETAVTTLETYDANGRLAVVTEAEGTPLQLTASYAYDVGDRLTGVFMIGMQSRTFAYDQRGFLLSETHPELGPNGNGTARYGNYDPHGHPGQKVTGPDNGLFDLRMTYDSAERLTAVTDFGATLRPLKSFTYAPGNDGNDLRNGKLLQATRYNHLTTGDFTVSETYKYIGAAGRPSQRDTVVQSGATTVQSFTQSYHYDPFGAIAQIDYPDCATGFPCGGSAPLSIPYVRSRGFLTGVTSYAPSISYNVNGSVQQVTHSSSVIDTYDPDTSGMPRPALVKFTGFQSCSGPAATVSGGGPVTPGNSAQIQVALTGTAPWSVTWSDGQTQSGITSSPATRSVTPPSTTTYTVTSVSDANCAGTSSGSATVTVSLDAPAGFLASTVTGASSQVFMQWSAVTGAGWYQVERASIIGGTYSAVGGHVSGTSVTVSFNDTVPNTYLYRVRSGATFGGVDTTSAPSAIDYATVAPVLFTDDQLAAAQTIIKGLHIGELRLAIDAVRRAANLPPVWSSYAPATGFITAADNLVARQKLDEAVVALIGHGVVYTGTVPGAGGTVFAYQLQQIREGVK